MGHDLSHHDSVGLDIENFIENIKL